MRKIRGGQSGCSRTSHGITVSPVGRRGLHGEGNGWKRFSLEYGSGKAVAWPNQDVGVPYPIPYRPATPRIKAG
jgi:hypothetical protein